MKLPILFRKKKHQNPGKSDGKVMLTAKRILGFEKTNANKLLKSPNLDEKEVIIALTRLQTDLNWVKRILWIFVVGTIASNFIAN